MSRNYQPPCIPGYSGMETLFGAKPNQLGGSAHVGPAVPFPDGHIESRLTASLLRLTDLDRGRPVIASVSIDVKVIGTIPARPSHLVRLNVFWGSNLGDQRASIDCKNGTRLVLECSSLNVDVEYLFQDATVVAVNSGPTLRIVASVGLGSYAFEAPTLTALSQSVAALASGAVIAIPAYARGVEIQSNADPTIGIPNRFTFNMLRGDVGGSDIIGTYNQRDTLIEIPNGAQGLRVNNQGPGVAIYTPVFHLEL